MRKEVWVDFETTGLDVNTCDIHQIGVVCEGYQFAMDITFDWSKLKHDLPIDVTVKRVHISEAAKEFVDFIMFLADIFHVTFEKADKFRFCGKNTKFDWRLMERFLATVNVDIYELFHYTPLDLESVAVFLRDAELLPADFPMKLGEMISYFQEKGFDIFHGDLHRGLNDAKNSQTIYRFLVMKTYSLVNGRKQGNPFT